MYKGDKKNCQISSSKDIGPCNRSIKKIDSKSSINKGYFRRKTIWNQRKLSIVLIKCEISAKSWLIGMITINNSFIDHN